MSTYLVLDANNVIQNNIEWDGVSDYSPAEGMRLVAYDGPAGAGWRFDGKKAIDPRPPEPPGPAAPPAPTAIERLAAELGMTPDALTKKLLK